jgi:hypothetical protein
MTGKCHANLGDYGIKSSTWEVVGQCLSEVIWSYQVVQSFPNAMRAWNLFSAILTDQMRTGYDAAIVQVCVAHSSI